MALADLLNDDAVTPMARQPSNPSPKPAERHNGHGELQLIGSLDIPTPQSLDPFSAPRYHQPLLMTSFSYGKGRELLMGERRNESLKEMRPVSDLPKDLNEGFDTAHWRDEGVDEGLDSLLDW